MLKIWIKVIYKIFLVYYYSFCKLKYINVSFKIIEDVDLNLNNFMG